MRRPFALVALAVSGLAWLAAVGAAPTLGADSRPTHASATADAAVVTGALVYLAGSIVCHQKPERSFHRDGAQLPVCARCLGLYAGGAAGVLGWAMLAGLRRRPSTRSARLLGWPGLRLGIGLLALPTIVSIATAALNVWDPDNALRALLALPAGAAIGALTAAVLAGDLR